MPSVEISKLQAIGPARALSESDRARAEARPAAAPSAASGAKPGVMVEVAAGGELDLANPPIDPERVEKIRAALRDGSYPLVPTQIADALIAAQVSLAVVPKGER